MAERGSPTSRPISRRAVLRGIGAVPLAAALGGALATPQALGAPAWATAAGVVGPVPRIISRGEWGADESVRRGGPVYDGNIRAGVVHHTATPNDYGPTDSAAIVRGIYRYHTGTLGWDDVAYNSLVDKYGQVFEGRFGGMTRPVEGCHTGGFNKNTWAVAMIGNFDEVAPTPQQLHAVGVLLGWRLSMDAVDPQGSVQLVSAGGPYTRFTRGTAPKLPNIFAHRDVGDTACPGSLGYGCLDQIRSIAARFDKPATSLDLATSLQGGAIHARWLTTGGMTGALGAPTSPETPATGAARYVTFDRGAIYWSPSSGAAPIRGPIYDAWGTLGFERGALGLPTSAQMDQPQWITQNFQHGTLNVDRLDSSVTRVIDGIALRLPPPSPEAPPVQLERFSPARNRV